MKPNLYGETIELGGVETKKKKATSDPVYSTLSSQKMLTVSFADSVGKMI